MEQQEKLLNKLKLNIPNNLLLIGPKYSGKKTLVSEITDMTYVWVDNNIENIRLLNDNTNYIFADLDDWSPICFSALLKILENNSTNHYIMTCKNILNIPDSIISRCTIEYMEPYRNIGNYCDNIGQLAYVTPKMLEDASRFNYKDDYDLDVFFTVVCNQLLEKLYIENVKNEYFISSIYNAHKTIKSLNKKQFINNWKLDMKGLTETWKSL